MKYGFREGDADDVARVLDSAFADSELRIGAWIKISESEGYRALRGDLRVEVDILFAYELQEHPSRPGSIDLAESSLPQVETRAIRDVPGDVAKLWLQLAEVIADPAGSALIEDLILTSRLDASPSRAFAAVERYLEAGTAAGISAFQSALYLARANSICRTRGMVEEVSARDFMRDAVDKHSVAGNGHSASLILLAALAEPPKISTRAEGELTWLRGKLYELGDNPLIVDDVASVLWHSSDSLPERRAVGAWHVEKYISFAKHAVHGMQKMLHADKAARLAARYELTDLRDVAVRLMQSISKEGIKWDKISTETVFSRNIFRVHLWKYAKSRKWQDALEVFLQGGPPAGDHRRNRELAEANARGSIRRLVSRVTFGVHGMPERAGADFMLEETSRTEVLALGTSAMFLSIELDYIFEKFSVSNGQEVAEWLVVRYDASYELAKSYAECLLAYRDRRYSDSARLSIPLVESAIRALLIILDEPLYRTEAGKSLGQFPAMDFYIRALRDREMDVDWVQSLRAALLSPGMNLRNLYAHGFLLDFTQHQAALLLRLAGMVCSLPLCEDGSTGRPLRSMPNRRPRRKLRLMWTWS